MLTIPYKSFTIRMARTGLWRIEKDGRCVMACSNEADGRSKIDKLRGEV